MNARTPESALASTALAVPGDLTMGFGTLQQFEFMQRAAKMIMSSTMVPAMYRQFVTEGYGNNAKLVENPNALPNCMIAMNLATRMRADVLMVMQNLHIIEGKPSWSSAFIISAINTCGRFTPLRFEIKDLGEREVPYVETVWESQSGDRRKKYVSKTVTVRDYSCVAYCYERPEPGQPARIGEPLRLESPEVTVSMAVAEGWYMRNGSKWPTMTKLMLHYRTAAFFGRLYAPEILMGLQTAEELRDIGMLHPQPDGSYAADDLPPQAPAPASGPVAAPQSKSARAAAETPPASTVKPDAPAATSAPAAGSSCPAGPVDQDTGEIGAPAAAQPQATAGPESASLKQNPAGAPPAAQAPASTTAPVSPTCSDGSRKYLLNKFKAQPHLLAGVLKDVGFTRLDAASDADMTDIVAKCRHEALDGMTEDQFKAAKARAPR